MSHFTYDVLPYAEAFEEHMRFYAALHGYDFMPFTRPFHGQMHTFAGWFTAALRAMSLYAGSEYIVVFDSDIFVADLSFRLEDVIAQHMHEDVHALVTCH